MIVARTSKLALALQILAVTGKVICWCLWCMLIGWVAVNMLFFKRKKWDLVTKLFVILTGSRFIFKLLKPQGRKRAYI